MILLTKGKLYTVSRDLRVDMHLNETNRSLSVMKNSGLEMILPVTINITKKRLNFIIVKVMDTLREIVKSPKLR